MSFVYANSSYSLFNDLEITNTSVAGVNFASNVVITSPFALLNATYAFNGTRTFTNVMGMIFDSDADGIPDATDAFPYAFEVSVDGDGDGVPDLWNANITAIDMVNSGLILDAFPHDPLLWQQVNLPVVSAPVPMRISVPTATGVAATDAAIAAFLGGATAVDTYGAAIALVSHNPLPTRLLPGVTTVVFSATDIYGNVGTAISGIQVAYADAIAPVITPPVSISIPTLTLGGDVSINHPDVVAFLASVTATDDLAVVSNITHDAPSVFPGGLSTVVTFSASDKAGNVGTAIATVTVAPYIDITPPVVSLKGLANITIAQGSLYIEPGTTVTDDVDTGLTTVNTGVVDNYTVGIYPLTYTATDAGGNTTSITRVVNVTDQTAPSIVLLGFNPKPMVQNSIYVEPGYLVSDNVDVNPVVTIAGVVDGLTIGNYVITYTVTDAAGLSTSIIRSVNVVALDVTAPVITTPATITVHATGAAGIAITDPTVAAFLNSAITNDSFDGQGIATHNAAAVLPIGANIVVFSATDTNGNVSTPVSSTVVVLNNAPVAVADALVATEDTLLVTANVLANDTDIENDVLSILSADTASKNGGVVLNHHNGTFSYTPATDFNGVDTFAYTVSDPAGGVSTGLVSIDVYAVNDAPTLAWGSVTIVEDEKVGVPLNMSVQDVDINREGDSFTYVAVSVPANGTLTKGLAYIPNPNFNGSDSFDFTATDAGGLSVTGTAVITVTAVNDAPTSVTGTITTSPYTAAAPFTPIVSDPDIGDTHTFFVPVNFSQQGGTVTLVNNKVEYVPSPGFVGLDSFTIIARDSTFLSVTGTINVNVGTNIAGVVLKQNTSSMTSVLTASTISIGQNITVSGTLLPLTASPSATVEVQFTNPNGGVAFRSGVTASDGTFNISYQPDMGGTWQVLAQFNGKETKTDMFAASSAIAQTVTVNKATTTLSLNVNPMAVILGNPVQLSGKLAPTPSSSLSLLNTAIDLVVTDPNGVVQVVSTTTNDFGNYNTTFMVPAGSVAGSWDVVASFKGATGYVSSSSQKVAVNAVKSAGYAILIEGRIMGNSGIQAHHKTLNNVYNSLIDRGFIATNIQYFSFNQDKKGNPLPLAVPPNVLPPIDAAPSLATIQAGFASLATKVAANPGPVYIVMVNHGTPSTFHIYQDALATPNENVITPVTLNDWLTQFETSLLNAGVPRKSTPIVVVNGSCYSATFVPILSKANRVIIGSADKDEVSYKGAQDTDGIRDGEFFVSAFFKALVQGNHIAKAFDLATRATEDLTADASAINGYGLKHFDEARQHPQLDDNGDGLSSDAPLDAFADGSLASTIVLGASPNAIGDVDILKVPAMLSLANADPDPIFSLQVTASGLSRVDTVWMEVKSPSYVIPATSQVVGEQVDIQLPRYQYTRSGVNAGEYVWDPATYAGLGLSFAVAGKYELFFYVKDSITGNISNFKKALFYRQSIGNNAPTAFSLLSPMDTYANVRSMTIMDWYTSTDNDGVSYQLSISTDANFMQNVAVIPSLTASQYLVDNNVRFSDGSLGLKDGTSYFWKVAAIDPYGAITPSTQVFSFTVNNPNSVITFVNGQVTGVGGGVVSLKDASGNQVGSAKVQNDGSFVAGISLVGVVTVEVSNAAYSPVTINTNASSVSSVVLRENVDTAAPIITVGTSLIMPAPNLDGTANRSDFKVAEFLNSAVAVDSVDGVVKVSNNAPLIFLPGDTKITFTAIDAAGNTASTVTTVSITAFADTIKPIVVAPGSISLDVVGGTGVAKSNISLDAFLNSASATDNIDGVINMISNDAPAVFPVGITIVKFSATDLAGNVGTSSAVVTITPLNNLNPTVMAPPKLIVLPADANGVANSNIFVAQYLNSATASDVNGNVLTLITNDAPLVFPVGDTVVTFTAKDAVGNSGASASIVTVTPYVDTQVPVITLLGSSFLSIEVNSSFIDEGAKAMDNNDGDVSSLIQVSGKVDMTTKGAYQLSYDVSDSAGNAAATVYRYVYVEAAAVNPAPAPASAGCVMKTSSTFDPTLLLLFLLTMWRAYASHRSHHRD